MTSTRRILITSCVYRLNSHFTVLLLLLFGAGAVFRQLFGDPIDCQATSRNNDLETLPPNILDTFCWVHPLYSYRSAWHARVGQDVVYPGVNIRSRADEFDRQYHAYYSVITYFIFLQAFLFYAPYFLWSRFWEGNLLHQVIQRLNRPILSEDDRDRQKSALVQYLRRNLHKHQLYAWKYFATQLFQVGSFVVVVQ